MIRSSVVVAIGAAAFVLSCGAANSQSRITHGQVITDLDKGGATAQKVGIDVQKIRADIEAHIQAEGTQNAKAAPTVLDALKQLPNFIVEIQFDLDSDRIRPQSWETVARIADALHHPLLAGNRFLIVGHTDAQGDRKHNLELSDRRAAAVANMLMSIYRIDASHLLSVGFGEEQLRDPSKPNDGVNRRVELINIGPA